MLPVSANDQFLTLKQVAVILQCPTQSVRYWVKTGKLRGFKPGRQVLITRTELEAFIAASDVTSLRVQTARVAS